MKKFLGIVLGCMSIFQVNASVHWDVYGVDETMQHKILSSCKDKFHIYSQLMDQMNKNKNKKEEFERITPKLKTIKSEILKTINSLGQFKLVELSPTLYPDGSLYTTIDLVLASDLSRIPEVHPRQIKKNIIKEKGLNELLVLWKKYNDRNLENYIKGSLDLRAKSCPFIHCTWGFDKKELEDIVPTLKKGTLQFKKQLIDMVEHSDISSDREEAIFLLAISSPYKDLAIFLAKYMDDADEGVRNNSMRVLASITSKHILPKLSINQIIKALNYPYASDRNKASAILTHVVLHDKSIHPLVIKQAGDTLINLLKLKQPNNHLCAYAILKIISNKTFSETDYQSWQKWLDSEKHKTIV